MKLATSSYVPLVTALFIVAHLLFLKSNDGSSVAYAHSFAVTLLTSAPLFLTAYLSTHFNGVKRVMVWLLGFIIYPMAMLLSIKFWSLDFKFAFSSDEFLLFIFLYLLGNANKVWQGWSFSRVSERLKSLETLSHVIIIILITLSLVSAFTLSSNPKISEVTNNQITINIDAAIVNAALFVELLLQFLLISIMIWCIYYINSRLLVKEVLAKYGVFTFFCAVIICVLVLTPICYTILFLLPMSNHELAFILAAPNEIFHKTNYQTVLVNFVIFTPLILLFEKHQQEQQMQQLTEEKVTSELKLLQQQVNPHFLFNSLNNIYAHALIASDKTPKLISRLSNMLRYTVYDGQKDKVSLHEEIQYLKDFIELQTLRAKENLHLTVTWPDRIDDNLSIAPLLLIIIVENAFKHAIEKTTQACSISINISIEHNTLTLNCENTLVNNDTPPLEKGGLGLENLQKRLRLIYPNSHQLSYGKQGTKWRVALSITLTEC